MNPMIRMMKRYIKTPLKYALPLLFISSLALVSISGCTSSTSSTPNTQIDNTTTSVATATTTATAPTVTAQPTVTPTAQPTVAPTAQPTTAPTPTAIPTATPTPAPVTGSFGQSTYVLANGTVVTATVSNWQSNPSVGIGDAHGNFIPMQPIGNGVYTYTFEDVVIYLHGSGTGGLQLIDNSKMIATATTTWTNP